MVQIDRDLLAAYSQTSPTRGQVAPFDGSRQPATPRHATPRRAASRHSDNRLSSPPRQAALTRYGCDWECCGGSGPGRGPLIATANVFNRCFFSFSSTAAPLVRCRSSSHQDDRKSEHETGRGGAVRGARPARRGGRAARSVSAGPARPGMLWAGWEGWAGWAGHAAAAT